MPQRLDAEPGGQNLHSLQACQSRPAAWRLRRARLCIERICMGEGRILTGAAVRSGDTPTRPESQRSRRFCLGDGLGSTGPLGLCRCLYGVMAISAPTEDEVLHRALGGQNADQTRDEPFGEWIS